MTSVALDCTRDALVLGDASCEGIRQLLAASRLPASPLHSALSPLEAISVALQQQRAEGRAVRSLHLIAHGEPGVLWLGDQAIDRVALLANAEVLANWGLEEIALWSCHLGADADFIALLEELTGASVLCSKGWLGRRGEQERYFLEQHSPQILASGFSWRSIDLFNSWPEQFELGRRNKRNRDALPFSTGDTFFGVDDDNDVWQVNPTFKDIEGVGQPFMKALRLYDPLTGDTKLTKKKASNGIAFDKEKDDLFFFYATKNDAAKNNAIEAANGASEPGKVPLAMGGKRKFNIVWWNIHADQDSWNWVEWADDTQGGFGDKVNQDSPANAVFHGESIWYFGDGNRNLYRLKLEYDEQGRPFAKGLVNYELDNMYKNGSYGDLAIREEDYGGQGEEKKELVLYGSQQSGRFFKLNLSVLLDQVEPPVDENGEARVPVSLKKLNELNNKDQKYSFVYKELSPNLELEPVDPPGNQETKALQLTFNNDSSLLWGQTYEPRNKSYSGVYYNISPGEDSVQASPPLYQAPDWDADIGSGFRDLGGSTDDPAEALPPDFDVNGIERCEAEWNGMTAKFQYNVTLQDIDIWNRVFLNNAESLGSYGPFFADFDVASSLGNEGSDYFVESIYVGGLDGQEFDERTDNGEIRFFVDPDLVDVQPSESDASIKDAKVPVIANIKALEGSSLAGDERAEMQLVLAETGEEKFAVAEFSPPKDCFPGSITEIKASAECIDVDFGAEQEAARFSFDITRQTSDDDQIYAYELSAYGMNGGEYEIKDTSIEAFNDDNNLVKDGVTVLSQSGDRRFGSLEIKGNVASFDAEISLLGDNFVGEEQLTLSLTNVYTNSNGIDQIIPATEVTGEADLQGTDCVINPVPPPPTPTPEPTSPPTPTPTPQPSAGEVESVHGTSACEIDATRTEKDAVFQFDVRFNPVGTSDQVYGYNFSALGDLAESGYRIQDIVFPDDLVVSPSGKASGDLLVPAGMKQFEVDVYLKSKQLLTGNEGIELTISNDASEATGDAILNADDCVPSEGSVQTVTGIAACEREGFTNQHRATFSFEVIVDPGDLAQIYDYSLKASGFDVGSADEQIEITGIDTSITEGVTLLTPGQPEGQLQVDAGVEAFRVEVSVSSSGTITGDESLELEIENNISSAAGVANLSALDCDSGSTLQDLDGVGYCTSQDGPTTNLKFFYKASFDPGPATLYGYELGIENLSLNADYLIKSLQFTDLDGGDVDVALQTDSNAVGSFLVGEGVDDVIVSIDAIVEGEITAQEALTLTIGDPQQGSGVQDGTGTTAEIGSDLDLGDACAEDPTAPQVVSIEAAVDCDPIDVENSLVSRFIYDVALIPDQSGSKVYQYSFAPEGFQGNPDAYDVSVVPSDLYASDDLDAGELQGTLEVAEGVSDFALEIEIQTGENRVESESLTFSLADADSSAEATASLQTSDCIEQAPDSHLYLLMNNSTSMLSPDPTTQKSSIPNSLEAQNRIAFASFERAAAEAGYGFRNVNDDSFESFGEGSREAILNNSTKSLAKTLQDYELVDDPNDGLRAGALVVHMITYGYIVDYRRENIVASGFGAGGSLGLNLAQRILLTSTPNEVFGNSINENPKWSAYGLPDPTERDYFPDNWEELGVNASNLYSGTEMLGAFKGLTHLLQEERQEGDLQSDESIFITMATDGRPERRPWWDRRGKQDEGLAIPLPEELGGDEITAAGLLYENDGSWLYNRDNEGAKQWPRMKKQLNRQINRIAKTFDRPSEQIIVDVVGLGEDSSINFPAIYDNLFNEQTFDDSDSTWTYNVMNHQNLPDFLD